MPQASDEEIKAFAQSQRQLVELAKVLTDKLFEIKAERDNLKKQFKSGT